MIFRVITMTLLVDGKDYIVYFNVSHLGLCGVLMLEKYVIDYASRQMMIHNKKYPTHDYELVTIVFALKI